MDYKISVTEREDVLLRALAARRGVPVETLVEDKLRFYIRQEIRSPEELLSDVEKTELITQVEAVKMNFLKTKLNLAVI